MLRPTEELPINEEPYDSAQLDISDPQYEWRNFSWLAVHQVMLRIGWIFKTESIVMPAFLDFIGGGPVLRGFLPVLNRFGFAVPPVLYAEQLKATPRKKWHLARNTFAMSVPFAILSLLWQSGAWRDSSGGVEWWVAPLVLLLYGIFFALTGMNQLSGHVLQGKLVRATHRGRLMSVSIAIGSPLAIGAAWVLMQRWLTTPDTGFVGIFAATAVAFAIGSLAMLPVHETADQYASVANGRFTPFREAMNLVATDADFRRLAAVAALFGTSFMLFPHYQTLGRERLNLAYKDLIVWLCVQNAAVAVLGILTGPLADRYGNRLALRLTILGGASTPLLACGLARLDPEIGRHWYWLVFATTGMTPVTIKLLSNYTLEIALREHHPRYVSTVGLCLAAPVIILSPLVGWLVGLLGYEPVFLCGAVLLVIGGLMTFWIIEPRGKLNGG
ncbi:MAG: MFS transporter [Planctomycetes bacterium]|nr:MFS transporter [Planctomycetota bacterium]